MDLTIRPAVPADAPVVCRLLNAVDMIEIGREETDLGSVEADLVHPEAALAENSWLAFRGEELVGYGLMWDDSGADRIDMDQYVLPGHQDAAGRLLDLMEAQAVRRAAGNGAGRAVVHMHLNTNPTLDTALITARGWSAVRRYHVLTRPLTPTADAADPAPVQAAPAGLTLRDCTAEEDRRAAHALLQETFAEHFDHQPRDYHKWLADLGELIDWPLVWIASLDGHGDVAAMVTSNHRTAHGWINNLGVRKEFRGRGIAGHLLRHAFTVYAELGRDSIGLGVDTANESGALRLYEAHGMATHFAVDTWEVTLPVPAA
ncbi:GNAT family N-acetyltransferase [Streptomyces yaizuensis]|uniref:GNAT family N-acetyltransferase n=1 Tax=Streptomyces yaizuensis TaxID=2989713 RepID=A0ABQ5NVS4_9ACTN|nr:GNAT family N-acetyltransferase [Streptomyces sp. YSPA8]GLF94458.1 GNAT family N-acetyltransferase [Streptomyces sp. YSPA8]